jgi:hypothetical protein
MQNRPAFSFVRPQCEHLLAFTFFGALSLRCIPHIMQNLAFCKTGPAHLGQTFFSASFIIGMPHDVQNSLPCESGSPQLVHLRGVSRWYPHSMQYVAPWGIYAPHLSQFIRCY